MSNSKRTGAIEAFKTHSNYLRAFARLAGVEQQLTDSILGSVVSRVLAAQCLPTPRNGAVDLKQVRASLSNAWGTEYLLALSGSYLRHEDVIRIANNWAVIQAYYAAYHAVQALTVAMGQVRPDSHPKTQNQYVNFWIRRALVLEPWTLGYDGVRPLNVPVDARIEQTHSWAPCNASNCWSLAIKALRTTREQGLPEARKRKRKDLKKSRLDEWRREEQLRIARGKPPRLERKVAMPRLSEKEKTAVDQGVRASGLLDYLYRLRIRSNYQDATMFTEGASTSDESTQVREDLVSITSTTLLVHELFVRNLIGSGRFLGWVDEWLTTVGSSPLKIGIAQRRGVLG